MDRLSGARVLITRSTGFFGKYVQAAVEAEGGVALGISKSLGYDLRNSVEALQAVMLGKPDIVIHLTSCRKHGDHNAASMFRDEVEMGMNLIHAAAIGGSKLVLASKAWSELSRENEAPFALGSMLRAYAAQYQLPWAWVLVPDLYGPGELPGSDAARPVADILGTFAKSAMEGGGKAVLPGTGKESLGLLFAADAAKAVVAAAAGPQKADILQIPESATVTAQALAAQVVEVTSYPGQISWDVERAGYPAGPDLPKDGAKGLGWKPETALKEGLQATAKWFVQVQEAIKPKADATPR